MKHFKIGTFIIAIASSVGCSTDMKMKVPADIEANTQVISATDRSMWSGALADETFTLGPYKITEVDRDWDSSSSTTLSFSDVDISAGELEGGYTYKITTQNQSYQGQCASKADKESLGIKSLSLQKKQFNLMCTCHSQDKLTSKINIQAKNLDSYLGTFNLYGQSFQIQSLKEREGMMASGPSGYRVDSDAPIGAVEVLKPGRVWLGNALNSNEKNALTCGFVGLMLYLQPEIK